MAGFAKFAGSVPAPLQQAINTAAQKTGISPAVLTGIWRVESGNTFPNPAVNSLGYGGLFGTKLWNAPTQQQANYAAQTLAHLIAQKGSLPAALKAYSGGAYASVDAAGHTSPGGGMTAGALPTPLAPADSGPNLDAIHALMNSVNRVASGNTLDLQPIITALHESSPASQPGAAPAVEASPNRTHGTRRSSGDTPLAYSKVIGYPYQGTHGVGFNQRGGSNNWQSENAVDLAAPVGTPVYAVSSGKISKAGSQGLGGRFAGDRVQVDGADNAWWYGHLSKVVVQPGQTVKAGQLIGYSGEANGVAHLHLAVENGNPLAYVG